MFCLPVFYWATINTAAILFSADFCNIPRRHFLFQGIFLTQGPNSCFFYLLHWQADSFNTVPPRMPQY